MEENKDRELDIFVKRIVNETGLEEPSNGFSDSVWSKIELTDAKTPTTHKPVISKFIWGVPISLVLGLVTYFIKETPGLENGQSSVMALNWSISQNFSWSIAQLSISSTYVYAFLGLAFFMGVQVLVLKHHFDSRYMLNRP